MGYRSDVAMYIQGPRDLLKALFTEYKLTWTLTEDEQLVQWELDAETPHIRMHVQDVKWYSDFKDVQAAEWVWNRARERSDDGEAISGRLIRVGEEYDVWEFGNDHLYEFVDWTRNIHTDFPT